jgi:hypothetical protein
MKYLFSLSILLLADLTFGQINPIDDTLKTNTKYDKALAEKLGGDDYGMKSYFLVILKTGSNTSSKAFQFLKFTTNYSDQHR